MINETNSFDFPFDPNQEGNPNQENLVKQIESLVQQLINNGQKNIAEFSISINAGTEGFLSYLQKILKQIDDPKTADKLLKLADQAREYSQQVPQLRSEEGKSHKWAEKHKDQLWRARDIGSNPAEIQSHIDSIRAKVNKIQDAFAKIDNTSWMIDEVKDSSKQKLIREILKSFTNAHRDELDFLENDPRGQKMVEQVIAQMFPDTSPVKTDTNQEIFSQIEFKPTPKIPYKVAAAILAILLGAGSLFSPDQEAHASGDDLDQNTTGNQYSAQPHETIGEVYPIGPIIETNKILELISQNISSMVENIIEEAELNQEKDGRANMLADKLLEEDQGKSQSEISTTKTEAEQTSSVDGFVITEEDRNFFIEKYGIPEFAHQNFGVPIAIFVEGQEIIIASASGQEILRKNGNEISGEIKDLTTGFHIADIITNNEQLIKEKIATGSQFQISFSVDGKNALMLLQETVGTTRQEMETNQNGEQIEQQIEQGWRVIYINGETMVINGEAEKLFTAYISSDPADQGIKNFFQGLGQTAEDGTWKIMSAEDFTDSSGNQLKRIIRIFHEDTGIVEFLQTVPSEEDPATPTPAPVPTPPTPVATEDISQTNSTGSNSGYLMVGYKPGESEGEGDIVPDANSASIESIVADYPADLEVQTALLAMIENGQAVYNTEMNLIQRTSDGAYFIPNWKYDDINAPETWSKEIDNWGDTTEELGTNITILTQTNSSLVEKTATLTGTPEQKAAFKYIIEELKKEFGEDSFPNGVTINILTQKTAGIGDVLQAGDTGDTGVQVIEDVSGSFIVNVIIPEQVWNQEAGFANITANQIITGALRVIAIRNSENPRTSTSDKGLGFKSGAKLTGPADDMGKILLSNREQLLISFSADSSQA